MYAYHISPIDFGWDNLKTVEQTAAEIGAMQAKHAVHTGEQFVPDMDVDLDSFLSSWEIAKDHAKRVGWEGDFRGPPVVFWIPHEDGFKYGFAFKQDNNGSTFVMTPVPMPWLG